ncbi:MAG: HAMP domain-containing sensor histidine kinase [Psychrobacter sp.]|nr:HAMP domain-containing sensor histidine kinase [Psychrobacter sp.]
MSLSRPKAIIPLMRISIISIIGLASILAFVTAFGYDLIQEYKRKIEHVKQEGQLLASSASSPNGVDLVADQVSSLLNSDPTLKSIVFYSIDHPIDHGDVDGSEWRSAWFANTVSINQAVTSRQIASDYADISDNRSTKDVSNFSQNHTLLGYINITVDVAAIRKYWFIKYRFIWLFSLIIAPLSAFLILRLLTQPLKQFVKLAKVSDEVVHHPEWTQLPVIQQENELKEVNSIKGAMIVLFNRLAEMRQEHEALKAYEQQLQNKDLSLDVQRHSFQSMITHELKTSLNAIFGGLQLLNNHYLSNEQQDALNIIRKGSQHLDFTLEQIIQLNRIEKGQVALNLVEFNPLQLISDLMAEFEPVATHKGLELTSHITHVDYKLEGDVSKIRLVLTALLDNAIKFTKQGKVIIESQLDHFDKNTRWRIRVIDTGIGMEKRYFEDIFSPFFQIDPSINREFEGVGVGLSLAKQMSQLLGASLEVESTLGQGSQFTFIIQLDNWHEQHNKHLLQGLRAVYYHQEQQPKLPTELSSYGLDIKSLQHVQSVIDMIEGQAYDLLLISEDVLPKKAVHLARQIRNLESTTRILIVYLYHPTQRIDLFEADLKAAGVDYCQIESIATKPLAIKIKEWLIL